MVLPVYTGQPIGIITEKDIAHAAAAGWIFGGNWHDVTDRSFRVLAVLWRPVRQIRMFASESFTVALTVTLTATACIPLASPAFCAAMSSSSTARTPASACVTMTTISSCMPATRASRGPHAQS